LRPDAGRGHNEGMRKPPETVTASEIGEWAFCPEALRLRLTGVPSANQPERDAGIDHHSRKAGAEVTAGLSIAIGRILIVIALLALAVLWAFNR
jgi:hypothetical protein